MSWSASQTPGLGSHGDIDGIKVPSMNKHNNLLSFLAVVQYYGIDFHSVKWRDGLDPVGFGATAEIRDRFVSRKTGFAFKRHRAITSVHPENSDHDEDNDGKDEIIKRREKIFNELVSEVTILGFPPIRYHQNFIRLEGVYWEIPSNNSYPWPVLVLEKADFGDLWSFARSPEGRQMSMKERLGVCLDVAQAIVTLHENGECKCMFSHIWADTSRNDPRGCEATERPGIQAGNLETEVRAHLCKVRRLWILRLEYESYC